MDQAKMQKKVARQQEEQSLELCNRVCNSEVDDPKPLLDVSNTYTTCHIWSGQIDPASGPA